MSKLADILRLQDMPPATSATPATPGPSAPPSEAESRKSRKSRSTWNLETDFPSVPAADLQATGEPLITCVTCLHFVPKDAQQPDGHCRRYDTETWGAVEFSCPGHEPKDAVDRDREHRRGCVEARLEANPGLQRAFEVTEAPLSAGPGAPVLVTVAVRHGDQILSGEILVPRERWDWAAFIALMESPERRQ